MQSARSPRTAQRRRNAKRGSGIGGGIGGNRHGIRLGIMFLDGGQDAAHRTLLGRPRKRMARADHAGRLQDGTASRFRRRVAGCVRLRF